MQLLPSKLISGNYSLVTTVQFSKVLEIGDPVSQAKIYQSQMADELIFVDLSHSKKIGDFKLATSLLRLVSKQIFLPLTIGGGVKSLDDFRLLLKNGADKVAINSGALHNPSIISEASSIYGSQCVVAAIDYKIDTNGKAYVYSDSGSRRFEYHPLTWAKKLQKLGAGEILLTDITKDGKKKGLELRLSKLICDSLNIPVILSGGCGLAKHFVDGFLETSAEAVAAGTFFCFQDQNPIQTRSQIKNNGIRIRA